jgi:serine protease Do
MTTRFTIKTVAFSLVLSLLAGAGLAVHAAEKGKAKDKEKAEPRAPLVLNTEVKAPNRDTADRTSYAVVVKRAAPSVVAVIANRKERPAAAMATPNLEELLQRGFPGMPRPRRPLPPSGPRPVAPDTAASTAGPASGVIISADGYVLTNAHVIEGAEEVKVALGEPRKEYVATVVGRDARSDVALLKIDASGLVPVTLGDSDQLELGDVVLALGNPAGRGLTVSRGIASALGREGAGDGTEDFLQTDAAINPGNSGGALLDSDGRLIGLATARAQRDEGNAGLGFAVPVNLARFVAEQLAKNGRVERALLGVETQPLEPDLVAAFNVKQGALISEVRAGGPADKGGLKGGDVVTRVGATEIKDPRQLQQMIARFAPGTEVTIAYVRDGKTAETTVKLGTASADKAANNTEGTGDIADTEGVLDDVSIDEVSPEIREQLNVPLRIQGVFVTGVAPGGPSARAGIQQGDIILELDRRPARTVEEAVKLSEEIKGPKILVQLWREGRVRLLVVDESKK